MFKLKIFIIVIIILHFNNVRCFSLLKSDTIFLKATKHLTEKLSREKYIYHPMKWESNSIIDGFLPNITGIPKNIAKYDIFYYSFITDQITSLKSTIEDKRIFSFWNNNNDTSSTKKDILNSYIVLIIGKSVKGEMYYAINHNCNLDFSNEKFRKFKNKKLQINDKIFYKRKINNAFYEDSTNILIYYHSSSDSVFVNSLATITFKEYTTAEINFDSVKYILTVNSMYAESSYRFAFIDVTDITKGNTNTYYEKGEFIKLNGNYFKIDSISIDGRSIILVKEKATPLIRQGTQIGWNPIPFELSTVFGDSVCFPYGFRGQYVLLCFWETSSYGHYMLKETGEVYSNYKNKGFTIIGIAIDTPENVKDFLLKYPLRWPQISIPLEHPLIEAYKLRSYYQTYLIGPNGKIIAKYETLRDGKLNKFLRQIFK